MSEILRRDSSRRFAGYSRQSTFPVNQRPETNGDHYSMDPVSFLCGMFKKKHQQPDGLESAADGGGKEEETTNLATPATRAPDDPSQKPPSPANDQEPQSLPLPPPPGGIHMRTASCHQHQRSSSTASKLVSSVSMKVAGSAAAAVGRQASRRENKEKKLKHEDSIWKKTIILGEKCRVPDEEDEDSILYDEKGNRIAVYHHRKSHSGALSFSRQTSCVDHQEDSSRK